MPRTLLLLAIAIALFSPQTQAQEKIKGVFFIGNTLLDMRAKYSSKRNFNRYCMREYIASKDLPPAPPLMIKPLKKMFRIPKSVRMNMYPFHEYDTISIDIHSTDSSKTIILDTSLKIKLSNILFNYAYTDITFNFEIIDEDIHIFFKNTQNGTTKYLKYHYSGDCYTDFTEAEIAEIGIDKYKIFFFLRQLKYIERRFF